MTGSFSKLGTSIALDSPITCRKRAGPAHGLPSGLVRIPLPFGSEAIRRRLDVTSADVVQVHTSSRAGSFPNAIAT